MAVSASAYRNARSDIRDALESVANGLEHPEQFDPRTTFDETRTTMPVSKILDWDDYSSWGEFAPRELHGLSEDELRAAFGNYRGSTWAKTALGWIKDGVPAIVLVEGRSLPGGRVLGDGRGRTSFAVGMGIKTLPVIILREHPREIQREQRTEHHRRTNLR